MSKSDDTINRQDVMNVMWKSLYDCEALTEKQFMECKELKLEDWIRHRIFVKRMYTECMKTILSLPSVEPKTECIAQIRIDPDDIEDLVNKKVNETVDKMSEPKKGHWIDEETNYLCSECHRGCWVNSDYCPWCGADMRGEKNVER